MKNLSNTEFNYLLATMRSNELQQIINKVSEVNSNEAVYFCDKIRNELAKRVAMDLLKN